MDARRLVLTLMLVLLAVPASASAANTWEGVWNSDFGRLTMSAGGSGSYEGFSPGTISGPASGNVNQGKWSQPGDPPKSGTYKFTLSGDGKSFSGEWHYENGTCGTACGWSGTCIEGACLKNGSAPATAPPKPQPAKDGPIQIVPAPGVWCGGAGAAGLAARAAAKLPCASTTQPMAPGGGAIVSSPEIARDQGEATVAFADDDDEDDGEDRSGQRFVDKLRVVLTKAPTRKARFFTCLYLHVAIATQESEDKRVATADEENQGLALLALAICFRVLADLNDEAAKNPKALTAADGCSSVRLQVPVRIKRKGSRYTARAKGKLKRGRASGLSVSCTQTANTFTLRVRPRKRSASLRSVVGRQLHVGLSNAGAQQSGGGVVAFGRP